MKAYTAEEMADYWRGYHTARLRHDEGGYAFARMRLEEERDRRPKRYRQGWEAYLSKQEREHEYSVTALLERY